MKIILALVVWASVLLAPPAPLIDPFSDYLQKRVTRHGFDGKIYHRYLTVIRGNAIKYEIDPYLLAKTIEVESGFRWWAWNGKEHPDACYGPGQVNPFWWGHHLWGLDKKLDAALRQTNDYPRYLKRIGYGTAATARTLAALIGQEGEIKKAIYIYSGSRKVKANPRDFGYWQKLTNGIPDTIRNQWLPQKTRHQFFSRRGGSVRTESQEKSWMARFIRLSWGWASDFFRSEEAGGEV